MYNVRSLVYAGIVAGVVLAAIFGARYLSPARTVSVSHPIQVRWLIAHRPSSVFEDAVKVFADELSKATNGKMQLQVVMPQDIGLTSGDVPNAKVFQMLDNGDVELATTYTVPLGNQDNNVWALSLPFLFPNYDAATNALDGATAQQILNTVGDKTSAHALAFTMSGGFRIIASKNMTIKSVADLKGKRIATSGGPVAEATLKALGAVPVAMDLESGAQQDLKNIDGIETTYSRLSEVVGSNTTYVKYINETYHSLFLTAILASNGFYGSLSPEQQTALTNAARAAAQVERRDSITLGENTRAELQAQKSQITTLTPSARGEFVKSVASVYDTFTPIFGSGVIKALQGTQ
jgi:TRAP-type C4-dicarboxylate transport system substrate-binding protein